ncbi:hypothetical protein GPL15_20430 [Clostridium sp. MCC353]|uniref:hypothetical protein n=1 Tax=Clostridium sp. MCC353 TaxID=2592646 RepID=UPI001C01F0E1|nr:hypothetical protein [Clostridium sp. MCC353]MBT9778850.1 hypothetical protein [Clostridium sp. MCC353]
MANINKANRQVCDVDIRVLKTMEPFLFFDTANTTTAGFSSEDTYAKAKGANKIAFTNPMEGTMTIEAQVAPFKLYALLSDGVIETTAVVARRETLKCETAGTLTLPAGAKAGTIFVYPADDFAGKEIKGTCANNTFTATTADEIAVGSSYEVGYLVSKSDGVQRISFNNNRNPLDYYITMNTVEKDESGVLTPYIITAYKAKPQKSLDLSFSSEGDPASVTITFSVMEDKDGNVIDMVELADEAE